MARITWPSISEYEAEVIYREVAEAASQGAWRLALDMTDVTFLASSGIGMLIKWANQCKTEKGAFAVFGLNDQLSQLLRMTRMDRLFPIVDDRDAAVKKVS